jgi:hypothetical protein
MIIFKKGLKMKYLLLVTMLFSGAYAVETNMTPKQVQAAQKLIKLYRYKCDTVDSALRSPWDGSISVSCNGFRYNYELEDVGGRWKVTVD